MELEQATKQPSLGDAVRRHRIALAVSALAGVLVFWPTLVSLGEFLLDDPDFSHGLLVPVIAIWILASKRKEIARLPVRSSLLGLSFLCLSLLIFLVGHRTFTNVLQRVGMWGSLVGSIWFLFGPSLLKSQPFPFFFLLFSIPPPYSYLSPLKRGLKSLATRVADDGLHLLGFQSVPQGNVLVVEGHRLEVADACSGIRSLMAIVATAVLFAYLFRTGLLQGALLTVTAVPITILVNVLRILIVAVALTRFDLDLTVGWPHDLIGLAVFGLSFVFLYASWRFYDWLFRWKPSGAAS